MMRGAAIGPPYFIVIVMIAAVAVCRKTSIYKYINIAILLKRSAFCINNMSIRVFEDVSDFLKRIPEDDAARILAHLKSFQENCVEGLFIKTLRGKIKEIVVKNYRIVFFSIGSTGYIVDAFRKKSQKTPKRIIEQAENIYKNLDN